MTHLVSHLDANHIVVASRAVPQGILTNAELRSQACIVPADDEIMLTDYARWGEKGERALLEVHGFGSGRVFLEGRAVDNWDGQLPRALFFYFIDRGMVTRDAIFETFWPNLSTREATNVFHVTKRKISEVLGIDLTEYRAGFYHIAPHIELSYDVAHFSESIQKSAVASPEQMADLLRRAILLYRDHFLTSLEMQWVKNRRQDLFQTYGEALASLAKIAHEAGDLHQALGLYLQAAVTNLNREDVSHSIMQLYRTLGQPEAALAVFERLKAELARNLGVSPAPYIQRLADDIRAEIGKAR